MQTIRTSLLFLFLSTGLLSRAQDDQDIRLYIDTYKDVAMQEMLRTGVPASIKLAQGIHETMAGTSDLVRKSNNHFGIKCKATWTGESVSHDDDARGECFRKYSSPIDSYHDHSDFLKGSPRYASLFTLDPLDYTDWAYGLKKAGYATNPRYPEIIVKLIEDYHLQDYSLIALGKMPAPKQEELAANDNKIPIEAKEPVAIVAATVQPEKKEVIPVAAVVKVEETVSYPTGEFKINETRVTYALKGTSLLSLAEQYNVPLARIYEFNEMAATETLAKDQLVYLQRKRKTGNNEFHLVKPGETVADIAQTEAIRLETLQEYNFLNGRARPAIGEQLYLRQKAPAMPRLTN